MFGLFGSFVLKGWNGLLESIIGMGIPIIVLFLLFRLRMLGAGDIKLLAVIGGITGTSIWSIMCYSFFAGGVIAAVQMMHHHNLVSRMQCLFLYIQTCFFRRQIIPYESGFDTGSTKNTIHFSIAIVLGYSCWLVRRWIGD